MKFGHVFLILATFMQVAGPEANDIDRYTLPPSKVNTESCQREALKLHPGVIKQQRMLHRHGDFWAEYEIQTHDGSEWRVLCDLTTGKIIREQKLIDDVF